MHVWNALDEVPPGFGPSVVTLGNFDGVHRGHRAVLGRVIEQAAARKLPSVAVTFDPHPLAVLHPERAPQQITSSAQRASLLAGVGVSALLTLPFTREFALQTPEEFVKRTFVDALDASAVVVGRDTRFGVRNSGTVDTLRDLGAALGFDVVVLDDVGTGGRWSSTLVRQLIQEGDMAAASEILGRPPRVDGTVVHGDHRGRTLGYPTANLGPDSEGLIPADGVYAGWLIRLDLPDGSADRLLPAAISIGTNPTFDGTGRRVEGYVLDRTDLELYGERIAYEFVERLRPTLRFDGADALIQQMEQDVAGCRTALARAVPS